jgi:hypothetical protein
MQDNHAHNRVRANYWQLIRQHYFRRIHVEMLACLYKCNCKIHVSREIRLIAIGIVLFSEHCCSQQHRVTDKLHLLQNSQRYYHGLNEQRAEQKHV